MTQGHDIAFYSALLACHQYAFIDHATTSAETMEGLPLIPLVPWEMKRDIALTPALLPLTPESPYMERLAVGMKMGESNVSLNAIKTLIATAPNIEQCRLEKHLISRLIFYRQHGGRGFLRYYSSDIFPHLVRALPPSRLKKLFGLDGQVLNWTFRFQNDWITVPAPEASGPMLQAWIMTKTDIEALDLVGEIEHVLGIYRKEMGRPWKDYAEWDEKARAIENILRSVASHSDADHTATHTFTVNEWAAMLA